MTEAANRRIVFVHEPGELKFFVPRAPKREIDSATTHEFEQRVVAVVKCTDGECDVARDHRLRRVDRPADRWRRCGISEVGGERRNGRQREGGSREAQSVHGRPPVYAPSPQATLV